ncbi:DNA translocase FtsK [Puniceibacterium sediminis]|uniref:DNA translocase FtsK n=1 Tax=Puniceibacterium sediminis TaxID=1608407 RepID=A0A238VEQ5_9RHOB|nr:DNA translocase FtsK [Puniceibacterium sediminis]SNR32648.1 DNA segregation ATPase FtsK/SpoIIIE, S-DNA-T family [Puniceibacterium sediminis]
MAYQARGRDPLFDSDMQAAIEKRGKELVGLLLVVLGCMAAAMIASYTPDDPSFMSATDAPVQNMMGRIGASIAAPLFMIVGLGSWGIALALIVWGLRMVVHRGDERAVSCLIFAPIWVAVGSVYAAGQSVGPEWSHSFGLGGLFGDMMMGTLLNILPVGASIGIKLLLLVLGAVIVTMGAFVLGFTAPELRAIARFLTVSLVMAYATLLTLLGRGASGAVQGAQAMQLAHAERRERRRQEEAESAAWAAAQEAVPASSVRRRMSAAQDMDNEVLEPVAEKPSFLSRMPQMIKRTEPMPEPELVEMQSVADVDEMPGDDRIRAKIADVIKTRLRSTPEARIAAETPLTKGRGRRPEPLIVAPTPRASALPPEPPVTAPRVVPTVAAAAAGLVASRAGALPAASGGAMVARRGGAVPPAPIYVDDVDIDEDGDERDYSSIAHVDETDALSYQAAPEDDDDDYAEADDYDAMSYQAETARPAIPVAAPKKVVQQPIRKPIQPSRRAQEESEPRLSFDEKESLEYELPPLSLLLNPDTITRHHLSDESLEENARMLESVLDDYGVKGEIVSVRPGPVVTMYELEPAPGLKASRVIGLADDIARSMSALSARVSTVPGRSVIGIELPNDNREMVGFREILSSRDYGDGNQKLPLALGKDIGGDPVVANLAKMPHLLIAGTTGSGKSVAINTMILSLLYKLTPDDCRMIMIDPKMLELSVYDGIPHLLSPVVTDPKKAVVALKWVVGEMEERYRKMSKMGVRNIDGYNGRVADALSRNEMFERTVQTGFDDDTGEPIFESEEFEPKKMPYIVVIVDEMADLMMVAGKEIEACIQRLAQMARASGIHLIMATQRPSVDVITGTIKANFPTRISFQVTSKIDSRTILGEMGAEQLLGMGDMLYMAGGSKIIRCHGPFVSDEEVEEVVNHLKAFGPPDYIGRVVEGPDDDREADIDAVLGLGTGGNTDGEDALYDTAVAIVIKDRKCSTSYIQRKLAIGYNKAARLVEQMEDEGVVSSANHVGKREILVPEQN